MKRYLAVLLASLLALPVSASIPASARHIMANKAAAAAGGGGADLGLYGYGSTTPGGAGGTTLHVTNCNNAGAGSFRNALAGAISNAIVVFDLDCTGGSAIPVSGSILIGGHHLTINSTKKSVTFTGDTISFENDSGSTAHDVIVYNLRHRGGGSAGSDNFSITEGAHDIVFDHVSSSGADDGTLDVTLNTYNVTVQWSCFSKPTAGSGSAGANLIKYGTEFTSWHHNIYYDIIERGPLVEVDDTATTVGTVLMVDIVNEVHYKWTNSASAASNGGWMNVRNSYYESPTSASSAVVLNIFGGSNGQIYTSGNFSGNGVNIDAIGNNGSLIGTPPSVPTYSAHDATTYVLANACAQPRDTFDSNLVTDIQTNGHLP